MSLMLGDCLETLRTLPTNSVDSVVTDPPYGLSFMGKKWDYDVPSTDIWKEVLRVLKPGGHVLSFCGTRTYHRMVVNMEDAGLQIRDQIAWLYGQGFPKSHNGAHGGTALKPAIEPICLARKPLEGTVAKNFEKWGVGGLNIDASRIACEPLKTIKGGKKIQGGNFVTSHNPNAETQHVPWENTQGRWPANVLFDEEAASVLDEQSGHLSSGGQKRGDRPYTKGVTSFGGARESSVAHKDSGGASRFFYVAKASKRERNAGLEGLPERETKALQDNGGNFKTGSGNERSNSAQNHHPTVKPIKLMQYLIRMITPPGGVVLDPFMGSGTTGCAAKSLGFEFIGCELSSEYMEIARKRIEHHEATA